MSPRPPCRPWTTVGFPLVIPTPMSPPVVCRWFDVPPPLVQRRCRSPLSPRCLFPHCPETCAHARGQCIITEWHAGVVPLVLRSEGRATLPRGRARYAVGTAPLCNVVGATAAPEREQFLMLSINVVFSGRLFNNRCPSMRPRCHPGRSCSCQAENPVGRSLPPQTGQAGTKVPGRRQGRAPYTTAT